MSERIVPGFPGQFQGVRETIAQVAFDRQGLVKRSPGVFRNLFGKRRDARVQFRRKLKIGRSDIAGIFRGSSAEFCGVHRKQERKTRIPDGRVVVKGIQQGIRGIPENISSANRRERVAVFAVEISFERNDLAGNENSVGGQGLEVNGVDHSRLRRICFPRYIRGANPAVIIRLQFLRIVLRGAPPSAVEGRKRDAPPAQPVVTNRLARLYAHDDRGILFDFADLTEFDVFRETGHEGGTEAGPAEVAGAETREKEKKHAADNDGSAGHAESGKTQRTIQFSIALGVKMEGRRNRAKGAAAQFHSDKSGNTEQEKGEKKNQESGIDGKNGCGENTRERQHGKKERVAVRDGAIETDDADENQKMHGCKKPGEQRRIGRISNRETRKKQGIHGEERQVREHAPGGGAVRKFGWASMPPANPFVKHDEGSRKTADDVKLSGADERDRRSKHKQ